jgi:hypothetical protein
MIENTGISAPKPIPIAILAGKDSEGARTAIAALSRCEAVRIEAVLVCFETGTSWLDHIKKWARRVGSCGVDAQDVDQLLRRAFPDREFRVADFQTMRNVPVYEMPTLDGSAAPLLLDQIGADYWILLDTPVPDFPSVRPRVGYLRGQVNLPPAELIRSGVRVTAEIELITAGGEAYLAEKADLPIHPRETSWTVFRKFCITAPGLLVNALERLATAAPDTLPKLDRAVSKSGPKGPADPPIGVYKAIKVAIYAFFYYSRCFHLIRFFRRWLTGPRCRILAYHRVNDAVRDQLTIGVL